MATKRKIKVGETYPVLSGGVADIVEEVFLDDEGIIYDQLGRCLGSLNTEDGNRRWDVKWSEVG
jgi:hypothetical protein